MTDVVAGRISLKPTAAQETIADEAAFARTGPLASERIADVLQGIDVVGQRRLSAVAKARFRQLEKLLTGLNPAIKHRPRSTVCAILVVSLAEIETKVRTLARTMQRFGRVGVQQHSAHIYHLTQN